MAPARWLQCPETEAAFNAALYLDFRLNQQQRNQLTAAPSPGAEHGSAIHFEGIWDSAF
jgi:hypothetical protein